MMRRGRRPPDGRGREQESIEENDDGDGDNDDDEDEPMDEDDQEVLVQDLEHRIRRQQERILSAFRVLCRFAGAATVVVAVLEVWTTVGRVRDDSSSTRHSNDVSIVRLVGCWLHAALSCGTHLAVPSSLSLWCDTRNAAASGARAAALVGLLLFHVLFVSVSRRIWDDARTGWGLGIANLLTVAVAAVLLWDRRDSHRALRELGDARYKHKTL